MGRIQSPIVLNYSLYLYDSFLLLAFLKVWLKGQVKTNSDGSVRCDSRLVSREQLALTILEGTRILLRR